MTQFDTAVPRSRSLLGMRSCWPPACGQRRQLCVQRGHGVPAGPEAYGALAALLALVLVGSVPAWPSRRWCPAAPSPAWPGRRRLARGRVAGRAGRARAGAGHLGSGLGLVLFLHLDSAVPVLWLALALAPTPLLFAVQGLLQGRERFGPWPP